MNIQEIKTKAPFNELFEIDENILNAISENIRLKGFDVSQPIVVWEGKKIVIDGHTRLEAAKRVGIVNIKTCEKPFADEAAALALLCGCAARIGLEQTGTMGGLDGAFRVYTDRTADKMGINTVSTFVVKDEDKTQKSTLVYGNTAGQPGIGKAIVEQILPAISNAAIGTTAGVLMPRPVSNVGNVGTQMQGQGQTTTQLQGQIQ